MSNLSLTVKGRCRVPRWLAHGFSAMTGLVALSHFFHRSVAYLVTGWVYQPSFMIIFDLDSDFNKLDRI